MPNQTSTSISAYSVRGQSFAPAYATISLGVTTHLTGGGILSKSNVFLTSAEALELIEELHSAISALSE